MRDPAAALAGGAGPGVVYEEAAHGLGGGDVEVGAAGPGHLAVADQSQVSLVHKGGCLERVVAALRSQSLLGDGAELVVDQGEKTGDALRGVQRLIEKDRQGWRVLVFHHPGSVLAFSAPALHSRPLRLHVARLWGTLWVPRRAGRRAFLTGVLLMVRTKVHRVGWALAAILAAVGGVAGAARAGIGYDNLTGNTIEFSVHGDGYELADDTTLDPSFGLTITSVSLLVRNPFTQGDYAGNLRVRVYSGSATEPGVELGTAQIPVLVAEGATQTFTVPFTGLTVPGVEIWTSFEFLNPASPLPGLISGGEPSVGSSTNRTAYRPQGTGPWTQSTTLQNPFAIRIETVPAPSGLTVLGAAGLGFARRRRPGQMQAKMTPRDSQ